MATVKPYTQKISQQDTETLVSSYRALVNAGHYLRSNEPLARLWAIGGDDLLQQMYDEEMSLYEAYPNDRSRLVFAVNLADFLVLPVWRAAVERVKTDLPGHPFTEMIVASYLVRTGEKDAAKPYMDRALAIGAGNPDIVAIAASMYAIDWKLPDRAMELIHQALEAAPDVAWYYVVRGDIFGIALNDHAAALKDYDHAVQLSPDHYPFRNMRALAHIALGDHAAAIADLEFALKVNPDSPNGRFALIKCYVQSGDMRGAAGALLAPRHYLLDGAILEANRPVTVPILPMQSYHLALHASGGERVTVIAESDDAKLVAPFAALIDPNGDLIAHSGFYASQSDTPEARVVLYVTLAMSGSYTVVVCENLSTWQSVGEGDLQVSLMLDE